MPGCIGKPAETADSGRRGKSGFDELPRTGSPSPDSKRPGLGPGLSRYAQKQNGSWCRHQPPLGPSPTASPVRAGVFPGRFGLVPSKQASTGALSGSGRGLATSVGSLSRPVSPKAPVSAGPSKKVGSAEASRFFFEGPTIASVACVPKDTARFRGGSQFGTSLPCGRNAPHREGPQWRRHPIRKSGILPVWPVDNGDIVDKSAPEIEIVGTVGQGLVRNLGRATRSVPGADSAASTSDSRAKLGFRGPAMRLPSRGSLLAPFRWEMYPF
jgi:hypothetical protein